MTTTELVAKEQIILSLLKQANAELNDAIERKNNEHNISNKIILEEDITNFRNQVIITLQNQLKDIRTEMLSIAGISEFTWRR
jgi:hypothetical protein